MQQHLLQPRSFSPQPLVSLPKDLLSSFSSRSLSQSFLSLSACCPGLNFLCTQTLHFQKQLREQPKTQRETEHCTMTVSLNCIAPAQTDIMCFGEKMHVCFSPCLYMRVCRGQLLTGAKNEQHLSTRDVMHAFSIQNSSHVFHVYASLILSCVVTRPSICILEFRPLYVFLLDSGWHFAPVEKVECGTPPSPILYQAIESPRPS